MNSHLGTETNIRQTVRRWNWTPKPRCTQVSSFIEILPLTSQMEHGQYKIMEREKNTIA